jgi:hypothetical protein
VLVDDLLYMEKPICMYVEAIITRPIPTVILNKNSI